jgi:ADP-ribosylglycohydrolase
MLPSYGQLREQLRLIISNKEEQGHEVTGLVEELHILPDSYDFLHAFAQRLARLPLRADWPYLEPNDWAGICAACAPERPLGPIATVDLEDSARRVEAAFLASVCGCILGKPLEVRPTLPELESAFSAVGEWPIRDYVSERSLAALGRRHSSWAETVRENIRYVAPDDDINYTVLGMLLLEQHGLDLRPSDVRDAWICHLPLGTTFGPERTLLVKAGMNTLAGGTPDALDEWVTVLNVRDEFCGALIRADAYGYACPGRPALAAELAWRDASWTHRRTGIYGTMFVAAAIAAAQVMTDRLGIFELALQYVPQRSRFHHITADCLEMVRQAHDWREAYAGIQAKYGRYGHCQTYGEVGALINTLRFAQDVGDGLCIQVMQGDDTDSFGATAGSLLGAYFGPGHLEPRWLAPLGDDIRSGMAWFFERSLSRLAQRMGELPRRLAAQIVAKEGQLS